MRVSPILTALIVGLAVVATAPAFLAFESHMVSVTARVVQPPSPIEKLRSGPDPVSVGTYQEWFFTIVVTNTYGSPMENVVVTDHLGAELGAEIVSSTAGTCETQLSPSNNQVRVTWSLSLLDPGHSETLVLRAFTEANPGGHQEYTSPGTYEQNSGATLKWNDNPTGQQFSVSTEPIYVTVVDPDADGDGVPASADCNDTDPTVYPAAPEVPYDGIDQDCDSRDLSDVDGDGHEIGSDCDDGDPAVYPGAVEVVGNGKDDDCNPATVDVPPPEPTATPSPTPEPTGTEVPVVEPTSTPLAAEATPTVTAEPVVEPAATPTGTSDEPAPAPVPTATPTPVAAEATPTSTAEPVVEPSATPTGTAAVDTPPPTPTAMATLEGG